MATKDRAQPEPSMEEILASIRQIISEDNEEIAARGGPEAPAAAVQKPDPAVEEIDTADILELTEMVEKDGRVVSLVQKAPPTNSNEPSAEPPRATVADAKDTPEPAPGQSVEAGEPIILPAKSVAVEPAPPADPEPVSAAEATMTEKPKTPQQTVAKDAPPEKAAAAPDELISSDAAASSSQSLARLAETIARQETAKQSQAAPVSTESGRTLEELVTEAMRPMLRDWLDRNLPTLIERVVRKEIQKLVRQVDD